MSWWNIWSTLSYVLRRASTTNGKTRFFYRHLRRWKKYIQRNENEKKKQTDILIHSWIWFSHFLPEQCDNILKYKKIGGHCLRIIMIHLNIFSKLSNWWWVGIPDVNKINCLMTWNRLNDAPCGFKLNQGIFKPAWCNTY